MPDELDLNQIEARFRARDWPGTDAGDLSLAIAEIKRLRALVATEQAKTAALESVFDTVRLWAYIYKEANNGSISDSEDIVIRTYLEACKALGRQP